MPDEIEGINDSEEEFSDSPTEETEEQDAGNPATGSTGADADADASGDDLDERSREGLLKEIRQLREDRRGLRSEVQELKDLVSRNLPQRPEKPEPEPESPEFYSDTEKALWERNQKLEERLNRIEQEAQARQRSAVAQAVSEFDATLGEIDGEITKGSDDYNLLIQAAAQLRAIQPKLGVPEVTKRAYLAIKGALPEGKKPSPQPNPKKGALVRPGGGQPARGAEAEEEIDDLGAAVRAAYRELKGKS